MPTDFTKPSQKIPKRYFTRADYEKGLCDKNGIAINKGEEVMAPDEPTKEAPAEETPTEEAEKASEPTPAETPAEPEAPSADAPASEPESTPDDAKNDGGSGSDGEEPKPGE